MAALKARAQPTISRRVRDARSRVEATRFATTHRLWHAKPVEAFFDPALEETIDAYYAAIAARRLPDWLQVLSPDVVVHEPAGTPPAEGHVGASEAWKVLTAPFSSLTFERLKSFFSGTGAAVLWRCRAVGVNGGSATTEGITVFEFDESNLVQTVVSYWDPAALLIELADGEDDPLH